MEFYLCLDMLGDLGGVGFYPCLDMLGDLGGNLLMSLPPVEFPSISGILIDCSKGLSAATSFSDDVDAGCRCYPKNISRTHCSFPNLSHFLMYLNSEPG